MRPPLYRKFQYVVVIDNARETAFKCQIVATYKRYTEADADGIPKPGGESFPEPFFATLPHPYETKGPYLVVDVAEYQMKVFNGVLAVYITPRRFVHTGYFYQVVSDDFRIGTFHEEQLSIELNNANDETQKSSTNHPTLLLPQT